MVMAQETWGGVWDGVLEAGGFDRIGLVLGLLLVCYILYKKGFKL